MDDRRRHLAQLARVLPRAETLFAQPRQRLDYAGENLGQGPCAPIFRSTAAR